MCFYQLGVKALQTTHTLHFDIDDLTNRYTYVHAMKIVYKRCAIQRYVNVK